MDLADSRRWLTRRNDARVAQAARVATVGLAVVACGGCISWGKRIDPRELAQIQIGVTTRGEVEKRFGRPRVVAETPTGGTKMTYMHLQGRIIPPVYSIFSALHLAGLRVPLAEGVLPELWTGGSSSKTEAVVITCDCNGIVLDVSASVYEWKSGAGLFDSNQRSFALTSRTATDESGAKSEPGSAEGELGWGATPRSPAERCPDRR